MGSEKVQPKQAKKEMANAKASAKSTKKFALNCRSAKSWIKKNEMLHLLRFKLKFLQLLDFLVSCGCHFRWGRKLMRQQQ